MYYIIVFFLTIFNVITGIICILKYMKIEKCSFKLFQNITIFTAFFFIKSKIIKKN